MTWKIRMQAAALAAVVLGALSLDADASGRCRGGWTYYNADGEVTRRTCADEHSGWTDWDRYGFSARRHAIERLDRGESRRVWRHKKRNRRHGGGRKHGKK